MTSYVLKFKMANQISTTTKYLEKLEKLEKEILKLKKGTNFGLTKKVISLKGILKGTKIPDKDIAKAKKSLFKTAKI